jgi:predicted O-methyltransferase YrrM
MRRKMFRFGATFISNKMNDIINAMNYVVASRFMQKNAATFAAIQSLNHPVSTKIRNALVKINSPWPNADVRNFKKIEQQRKQLMNNNNPLMDGTLSVRWGADENIRIADACRASKPYRSAINLYYLIRELQPRIILELGTNLGISSSYLALAGKTDTSSKIITLDASPYRIRVAKSVHKNLGLQNISYHTGLFTNTLPGVLKENNPIDFAFIDGHHQYQPTIDYFNEIFLSSTDSTVYVFDDITWSDGMKKAWNEITNDPKVQVSFDIGVLGIVVCSKNNQQNKPHNFTIDTSQPTTLNAFRALRAFGKSALRKIRGTK